MTYQARWRSIGPVLRLWNVSPLEIRAIPSGSRTSLCLAPGSATYLERQKDLHGAVEAYQASLPLQERLVVGDPSNTDWQKELGRIHLKLADVFMALGDMSAAVKAHESNIEIHEHLVGAHPDNVKWQRDLAVSHVAVIKVLMAQGNLSGASRRVKPAWRFATVWLRQTRPTINCSSSWQPVILRWPAC